MDARHIGENIRQARSAAGLTVTTLAERAGLSKGALSKIETGAGSASVSTLIGLAEALGRPLAEFFQDRGPEAVYTLTRAGERPRIVQPGERAGYDYEALAVNRRQKRAEPFILTMQPDDPEGVFKHSGEEFVYMLEGRVDFTVAGETLRLGPGDSLYFDPTHEHRTKVVGKKPAKLLCVFLLDPLHPESHGIAP